MEQRKDFQTIFGDLKIIHVQTPLCEEFNGQAPTGVKVIGRIRYLIVNTHLTINATFNQVAIELDKIWIFGLNIYSITRKSITDRLDQVYNGVPSSRGSEAKIGFKKLLKWPNSRRNSKWHEKVKEMSEMLQTGFDIKTNDASRIKILEGFNLVKMKQDEIKLYEDNCKKKLVPVPGIL